MHWKHANQIIPYAKWHLFVVCLYYWQFYIINEFPNSHIFVKCNRNAAGNLFWIVTSKFNLYNGNIYFDNNQWRLKDFETQKRGLKNERIMGWVVS